jgi:hypothetical protein
MLSSFQCHSNIRCRQIISSDVSGVVGVLARCFPRNGVKYWLAALERLSKHSTPPGLPKYGYLLEKDGVCVGVLLLIFSTIRKGNASTIRCNVSSWCAEPAVRTHASLLVLQALKTKSITYLNISPSTHVLPVIQAQGFTRYSNGQFVAVPTLGGNTAFGQVMLSGPHSVPKVPFEPYERDLLLEHAAYGCISLWCSTSERAYPFVFLPRVVKGFIPCVQLAYCRHVEEFVRFARLLGSFLILRGRPLVLIDANGPIPGLVGRYFEGKMPKYYKGPEQPRLGDLAYTEAVMFGM